MDGSSFQSCGALRSGDEGRYVRLFGWIDHRRDLGGVVFLTLRDQTGTIQFVASSPSTASRIRDVSPGTIATLSGLVRRRRESQINADLATGEIEVEVDDVATHGCGSPPDQISDDRRSLDERIAEVRKVLAGHGFVEIGFYEESERLVGSGRLYRAYSVAPIVHDRSGSVQSIVTAEMACSSFDDLLDLGDLLVVAAYPSVASERSRLPRVAAGAEYNQNVSNGGGAAWVARPPATGAAIFAGGDLRLTLPARGDDDAVDAAVCLGNAGVLAAASIPAADRTTAWRRMRAAQLNDATLEFAFHGVRGSDAQGSLRGRVLLRVQGLLSARESSASFQIEDLLTSGRRHEPDAIGRAGKRIERWDDESSAALVLSRSRTTRPPSPHASDPIVDLGDLLNDFSMTADICAALLSLFPALRDTLSRMPRGERFQWLWSILGNDFVRAVLRDRDRVRQVRELIEQRIITNPRQLIYIDADVLADVEALLATYSGIADRLRRLLASRPASFSAIAAALASRVTDDVRAYRSLLAQADASDLLQSAAAANLGGPFSLPLLVHAGTRGVPVLAEALRSAWQPLLRNVPVDVAATATLVVETLAACGFPRDLLRRLSGDPTSIPAEIVFHAFRPTNVGFRTVARWIRSLPDRTEDFARNGLVFGGAHWSAPLGAYAFPTRERAEVRVVPSKNILSYFAKASAGVCTGRDPELFSRPDHLHLNVVAAEGHVTGTIQTHVITDRALRLMILRSINVSTTYLEVMSAGQLVEYALAAAIELAIASDVDELHLGESLGIWHMNSSRSEIRAVLEDLYDRFPRLVLERPLPLFTFAGFDLELATTYRIWSAAEGTAGIPLFGRTD